MVRDRALDSQKNLGLNPSSVILDKVRKLTRLIRKS